jgi:pimeloyl-ACP methyl ester carboxylesterase
MTSVVDADRFPVMRTLDELKAEVQARADRNAYPVSGLVPDEVREALARLCSLDRDAWAESWSAIGDRYMEKALRETPGDAREAFLTAWRYYSFARWPVPIGPGKERAYAKALEAFRGAAASLDPPLEVVTIPFEGSQIVGYLRLPKDARGPVPVVVAIGGLDSRKEDMIERFGALLPHGIGALGLDGPGTGEAPLRVGAGAERMFSRAIEYLLSRPEVDPDRIVVYGGSFGGLWAARLAIVERDRLRAVVAQSPPTHEAFSPAFLERALVTKEYLFDRGPALASIYDGVSTPEELFEMHPRNSLVALGLIERPTIEPMLVIGGVHDTQVPIADIELLLRTGNPKTAWINPNGGHMGRQARGWTDPVIFAKVTTPWILHALAAEGAA